MSVADFERVHDGKLAPMTTASKFCAALSIFSCQIFFMLTPWKEDPRNRGDRRSQEASDCCFAYGRDLGLDRCRKKLQTSRNGNGVTTKFY